MKLLIAGIIDKVLKVEPMKKRGFTQRVIIEQPQINDTVSQRMIAPAMYYVVTIFSTSETDGRFLQQEHKGQQMKASVYLKGERWINDRTKDYQYNHKLNLNEWVR
jgi:hypothetical protein